MSNQSLDHDSPACRLRAIALGLTALVGLAALNVPAAVLAEPFVFVSLPDTQRYAEDLRPPDPLALDPQGTYRYFVDQTRWIRAHADERRIRCVIHLGDVVQTSTDVAQWERSKAAMDVLHEAGIPYGVCIGNHDLGKDRERVFDTFLAYFGPARFAGRPWFGGASPEGTSTFLVLEHEGYQFLFLNLCYSTPEDDVRWADEVLAQHRDKIVIISTHGYLWDSVTAAGRYGERVDFPTLATHANLNRGNRVAGSMNSQAFYESFVQRHPNILMVQCGHSGFDWYRTDGTNGAGLPVIEALTNYQTLPNGGEGYLRIYEIDPRRGTLSAVTYSPTKDRYRTHFEHFVQLIATGFQIDEKLEKRSVDPALFRRLFVSTMRRSVDPMRDVVGEHPDYAARREYYRQLFHEAFLGPVPSEAGVPEDWESMWAEAFAADPDRLDDYGPNGRSPSWTVRVELDRYVGRRAAAEAEAAEPLKAAAQ